MRTIPVGLSQNTAVVSKSNSAMVGDQNIAPDEGKAITADDKVLSAEDLQRVKSEDALNKLGRKKSSKVTSNIRWSNVNFKAGQKSILTDCWGGVASGQVCAIMGPSGAGKSSLLNVLAGRSAPDTGIEIDGNVWVAGKEINPVAFRKNIAYVMQDDALLATATPREALTFSANMRLPDGTSREEIDTMVQNLLELLGIDVCADVMIGNQLIKGISGGQRKRTSVGVEIITDPSLLFLDEPTSGLDSHSAYNLVQLLRTVAETNTAILCTIHQPSSEVFFLFDTVIYMKDGRIFYQGPVTQIVSFFSARGRVCPQNYNPSDFVMNLCQVESAADLDAKGLFMEVPPDHSSVKERKVMDVKLKLTADSSFSKQLAWLLHREWTSTYRDTAALIGRFGVTGLLNLLVGLIFLNAAGRGNSNDDDFYGHVGALTMVTIMSLFGSAQSVLLAFPFERPVFLREYSTGTYGVVAYFLCKLSTEIPLTFAQTILQYLLVYFLIDLQGNFILLALAAFGLGMISNSIAVMLSCALPDVKDVEETMPLMFVPQILFAGFFIRTEQIPVFLRWAQYLVGMKYAINLIFLTEFNTEVDSCNTDQAAMDNCRAVLDDNDIDGSIFYVYIIIMFALFAAFRLFGAVILTEKAKKFY